MSGHSRSPVVAGVRFGRLTTVEEVGRAADGHKIWRCICDCGVVCVRQSNNLRGKAVKHCGCAARDLHVTHGMRGSPEYISWQAAKKRCLNDSDKDYRNYGARGIRMCQEWVDSFEAFYTHMGRRPEGMTLERKDTNGNYEPSNCVWATHSEQGRNRRQSVYVDWRGSRQHLMVVAADLGITYGAAFMRHSRGKLHDSPI